MRFSYLALPHARKRGGRKGRPVICINDGIVFNSVKLAAEHYGIDPSSISSVCRRKPKVVSVNGLIFRFESDETEEVVDLEMIGDRRLERAVVCCADGKRYRSISAAAEAYGVSLGAISSALRGKAKTTAGGRVFRYADDPMASEIVAPNKRLSHTRRVLCETDGKEYASVAKAALAYGIDFRKISAAVLAGRPTVTGLVFSYL